MDHNVTRFDLDTPLLEFSDQKNLSSFFTIRDAVEGLQIFGGIGSGKTSGSGRKFALKYLLAGFGGLVLTAKPDEKDLWEEYCRLTNRTGDLIIVEPGGRHHFNFLEHEANYGDKNLSITENVVQVLKTVIKASEEKSSGKSDDPFWETSLDMLMFNVIDLCQLAYGKISVQKMYDVIMASPKKGKDQQLDEEKTSEKNVFNKTFSHAQANVMPYFEAWKAKYSTKELEAMEADGSFDSRLHEEVPQTRTLAFIDQFFSDNYFNLSEKTRSIIELSLSGFLFRLLREPFNSLFCNKHSTYQPQDSLKGKIILVNLPVKTFYKTGRDIQIMYKYIWQRAMEKRKIADNQRPVFLWADEAQFFLHEHDAEYQATARSSRIATVYLSQNLPNYYANMGGTKFEFKVKSFLGTLGTKIFHANGDIETNQYASDMVGEAFAEDPSRSTTISGKFSTTSGMSYKLEKMVRPEEFVSLRTGGPINNYRTEAIIQKQGDSFPDGFNHKRIRFNQRYTPNS